MTSYTTLVNVDADIAERVANYLSILLKGEGQAFLASCKTYVQTSATHELVMKFMETTNTILTINEKEAENCFQSIFSLMYTVGTGVENNNTVIGIVKTLTASNDSPKLRLRALVILFNMVLSPEAKFHVLDGILSYTRATNQTKLISHFFTNFEQWTKSMGLETDHYRKLLQSMAISLEQQGNVKEALKILIKLFKTYSGSKYPAEVVALVKTALVSAIKSPINSFSDRASLLEALQMETFTGDLKQLFDLLKIICDGSVTDYYAYKTANSSVLTAYKINEEELENEMKLLTFCVLSMQSKDGTISYDVIAKALSITNDEVEYYVIDAVANDLVDAAIDQLNSLITVSKFAYRSFGMANWKTLQQKLRVLRSGVVHVAESLSKNKAHLV